MGEIWTVRLVVETWLSARLGAAKKFAELAEASTARGDHANAIKCVEHLKHIQSQLLDVGHLERVISSGSLDQYLEDA